MLYLFHSIEFIIFFVIVFSIYWILPKKAKNTLLLIASYVFYANWNWKLLSLILISTYVNYFCGLKIHYTKNQRSKKIYLILSIIVSLSLLGFFKYFNFFVDNLISLLNFLGLNFNFNYLHIILPIGISFYTFQTLSYTIDIYRKELSPTKNIIDFSLFVSYFPQLIAGPIERAKNLIPKIQSKKFFKEINFKEGTYLFIYGLFKKVVIADSVGRIVDNIFSLHHPTGAQVLLATYAFAIQIYCDFSGYSNMARGISHFFGIKLSTNFNLPYLAKNPSDFWKRWHITLSSWVRDYIYIPLGGIKRPFLGMFPILITMSLMGLWHGADWNFVLWGLYWFFIIMIYRSTKAIFKKVKFPKGKFLSVLSKSVSIIIMFHITCYSWIVFRSQSLTQIYSFTKSLVSGINLTSMFNVSYLYLYVIILFLIIYESWNYVKNDQLFICKTNFYYRLAFYLILFFMYVEIGAVSNIRFIYFQF